MKFFHKFILLFIVFCCITGLGFLFVREGEYYITINNKEIEVDIADTDNEQYQGLSNREKLCADCGMLFVYDDKKVRDFVMRNMNFDLDIIWIEDDEIVRIDENLYAEGASPTRSYSSGAPVNYVLEVNSGFCGENGIKVGDIIDVISNS